MSLPEVRIVSNGRAWGTTVTVDGQPVNCVSATWRIAVGERATVELEIDGVTLDVLGDLTGVDVRKVDQ